MDAAEEWRALLASLDREPDVDRALVLFHARVARLGPPPEGAGVVVAKLAVAVEAFAARGERAPGAAPWSLEDPWPRDQVARLLALEPAPAEPARARLDAAVGELERVKAEWRAFLAELEQSEDGELVARSWARLSAGRGPPREAIDAVARWLARTLEAIAAEAAAKRAAAGKPSPKVKDNVEVDPWPAFETARLLDRSWKPAPPARAALDAAILALARELEQGSRLFQFYAATHTDVTERFRALGKLVRVEPTVRDFRGK